MYDLNCPYDIHYICDMTLTCNDASHCICTGVSYFMGVSAWLESTLQLVIDGRLGTIGRSPTESHGCMKW